MSPTLGLWQDTLVVWTSFLGMNAGGSDCDGGSWLGQRFKQNEEG